MEHQDAAMGRSLAAAPMQPPPPPLPPGLMSAPPTARRSRRRWWAYGCGGCGAIVLIIVIVTVVSFTTSFSNSFSNSPLRYFPTEAGASVVGDNFTVGSDQSGETLVIDDPNSLTEVETYYQNALNTNGWTVQATDPSQAVSGDGWPFSKAGSSAQFLITFVTMGSITEITVQYATGSSTQSPIPTSQRVDPSVTALMLTADEATAAAGGAVPAGHFTDSEIGGLAGTDQRTFIAADGSVNFVIAVAVDSSAAAATSDYSTFVSDGCPPGDRSQSTHPTIGPADTADEYQCASGGDAQVAFVHGAVLCGVSSAQASISEALARAESAKITEVTGV